MDQALTSILAPMRMDLCINYEECQKSIQLMVRGVRFTFGKIQVEIGETGQSYLSIKYYNCVSHGSGGEQFVIVVSDVVLQEKLENNPEMEEDEYISRAEEAFSAAAREDQGEIELEGEFSLMFYSGDKSSELYDAFSRHNADCEDPPEIAGGDDEEGEDEIFGGEMDDEEVLDKRKANGAGGSEEEWEDDDDEDEGGMDQEDLGGDL